MGNYPICFTGSEAKAHRLSKLHLSLVCVAYSFFPCYSVSTVTLENEQIHLQLKNPLFEDMRNGHRTTEKRFIIVTLEQSMSWGFFVSKNSLEIRIKSEETCEIAFHRSAVQV